MERTARWQTFTTSNCNAPPDSQGNYPPATTTEFYQINEDVDPRKLELDKDGQAKCADVAIATGVTHNCPGTLPPQQAAVYNRLFASLNGQDGQGGILNSSPPCPGDGNLDGVVNQKDVQWWKYFSQPSPQANPAGNTSSWYDFDRDGSTDEGDLDIIRMNLGTRCSPR